MLTKFTPELTVIVPVYNSEMYLGRCVDYILDQNFTNFILILVDDGSSDASGQICDEFALRDKRILALHKDNGGPSSARNLGLKFATGKWIVFIDSDDCVTTDYFSELINDSKNLTNGLVFQNYSTKSFPNCYVKNNEILKIILKFKLLDFSGPYAKLFNNRIIQENEVSFPEDVHIGEDLIFLIIYLCVSKEIFISNKSNYILNKRTDSIQSKLFLFESEYNGYLKLKKNITILFKESNFYSEKDLFEISQNLFIRTLLSVFKGNYTFYERKELIKRISAIDFELYFKYYIPLRKKEIFIKYFLKKGNYFIVNYLYNLIY